MPSNNSKYTQEMRDKTARYVLETGKSATSVAEELGINTNTVCKWVREYRRNHVPEDKKRMGVSGSGHGSVQQGSDRIFGQQEHRYRTCLSGSGKCASPEKEK